MGTRESQKGIAQILVALLLVGVLALALYGASHPQILFPRAAGNFSRAMQDVDKEDTISNKDLVFPPGTTNGLNGQVQQIPGNSAVVAGPRPNIIIILTDDQPPNTIGVSGNSVIKTPNIDSLEQNGGVYFKNMYLPIGQCAPSRASLWTGVLPHTHGVTTNGLLLPLNWLTLPKILQAYGYSTALVGKCHLGDPKQMGIGYQLETAQQVDGDWYNYSVIRNGVTEQVSNQYLTDFLTKEGINFIKSAVAAKKPFFLQLAPNSPHWPTVPPNGANRYTLSQIPRPSSMSDDLSTKPREQAISPAHQAYAGFGVWGWLSQYLWQTKKNMYEDVSNIDDNVGLVVKTLNDLGVRDNTIVIYLSDNGLFYGEHQLFQKGPFLYEELIKTPFIFSYPKFISGGRTTSALAESIDILPTILDFTDIPIPSTIQGKTFKNVLMGSDQNRRSVFMEYFNQGDNYPLRGVVSNGFKLTHYLGTIINGQVYGGAEFELYDLAKDPTEVTNILKSQGSGDNPLMRMISDPMYGSIIRRLRKEMAIWQTNTTDPARLTISNLQKVGSSGSMVITWTSNAASSSEVEYTETNCGSCQTSEVNNFNMVTSHSVTVNGLKPGTAYKFRVFGISPNANGAYTDFNIDSVPAGSSAGPQPL